MKKADRITGLIVFLFSVFIIQESWRMPQQSESFEPGVGFFPLWLGLLLAVLSVFLVVQSWRPAAASGAQKRIFRGGQALVAILLTMAGLAVYILLLEVLGYLLDTALLSAFLLTVVMRERWKLVLFVSLTTSVSLYALFQVLLKVNLPKNMIGF